MKCLTMDIAMSARDPITHGWRMLSAILQPCRALGSGWGSGAEAEALADIRGCPRVVSVHHVHASAARVVRAVFRNLSSFSRVSSRANKPGGVGCDSRALGLVDRLL